VSMMRDYGGFCQRRRPFRRERRGGRKSAKIEPVTSRKAMTR
jgi:hypothetical protein